ncbi:MAG: winged helix-turn-helix transcriptional regulator [Ruminococcaceae bacterium]|nr:winged helix-turn-helix transcriptional regulator [Oscillospiraceae bacterium]
MLTQKQFDLLVYLTEKDAAKSQRAISQKLGMSVGAVNKLIKELTAEGLIEDSRITEKGYDALEPYRVKRAIFMAAGFGSRMVPLTLNTPKPLVRVKGTRMIDTLLDAVIAAGIPEIYVIRGYLSEQFDQLLYKYPMIKFIENPLFNEANNIASIVCAGPLIRNAYILEADLVLSNPKLITKYQYSSNYLGIPVERTDDWCIHLDKNGYISTVGIGGINCHQIVGISYWTDYDGSRLVEHIKHVYNEPGGKERLWGQVPLVYYHDEYQVSVRECRFEDVVEIDTFNELKAIDPLYKM